jgi:hypothetical protein
VKGSIIFSLEEDLDIFFLNRGVFLVTELDCFLGVDKTDAVSFFLPTNSLGLGDNLDFIDSNLLLELVFFNEEIALLL